MTPISSIPAERNSAIVALNFRHPAAAGQRLEYTVLPTIVQEDAALTELQVGGTITSAIFALAQGGIVKNCPAGAETD